jgi:hypothetical protein
MEADESAAAPRTVDGVCLGELGVLTLQVTKIHFFHSRRALSSIISSVTIIAVPAPWGQGERSRLDRKLKPIKPII